MIALSSYSLFAAWAYTLEIEPIELSGLMRVPAAALLFVVFYNSFYRATYRRLGNIAVLNQLQLLFDALVVSVLIYYSGGVNSWFWSMYALFIFEAAFILPRVWHAWLIAASCALMLGFVVWGPYLGLLPPVAIPFASSDLYQNFTFVSVRYLWQLTVLAGAASIATMMMATIRGREEELAATRILDETTGLYNRAYFHRALGAELNRARRRDHSVCVILIDIDEFGEFNRRFGIERGDQIIMEIDQVIRRVVTPGSDFQASANVCARYGGEEFAIVLAEGAEPGMVPSAADALVVAEQLRQAIAETRVDDVGVCVSVGVAEFPSDGQTVDDLLAAADDALGRAAAAGGNRVASTPASEVH